MFLTYFELYIFRLRRCAMAYFYFSREKVRILHLYNKCLKKRRGMFELMSATVREQHHANNMAGRPMHVVSVVCVCVFVVATVFFYREVHSSSEMY